MSGPPAPTFLIIGAQKSATRWLRTQLGLHPDIFTATTELEYFNHHFPHHPGHWYIAQFEGWAGEPIVGEATPGYMFHNDRPRRTAARIHLMLGPGVRLFAVLREPVTRLRSAYIHHLRRDRIPPEADPIDYLRRLDPDDDPLGLITGGWYGRSLEPFELRFGRNLHIEFHDDIASAPEAVMARALSHLDAPPFAAPTLRDVTNSGVWSLGRRHPNHPILELGRDELSPIVGHWFDDDTRRLRELVDRPIPWDHSGDRP